MYNSDGCVGRCDAKCYEATGPECDCVCGGRNHGAGLEQAVDNTRVLAEAMIEEYVGRKKLEEWRSEIPALEPVQLPLFEI